MKRLLEHMLLPKTIISRPPTKTYSTSVRASRPPLVHAWQLQSPEETNADEKEGNSRNGRGGGDIKFYADKSEGLHQ